MPTFRGKRFTDTSLLGLARIETIRQIALYDTVVTDEGLIAFATRAQRLAQLHISSSQLTDRGLSAVLEHCPINNLQVHDAVGVTDACAPSIAAHQTITELYLNGTSITDEAARCFADMPKVWSFCANGCRITDAGLKHLGMMPSLALLSLIRTGVRGHGLRDMAHIDDLDVYLEDCRVTDEGVAASLPSLTRVKTLSLSKTDVTDVGLQSIAACSALNDLRLDHTGITDATVDGVESLPRLEVLYVQGTRVSRDRVAQLRKRARRLTVYSDFQRELDA